MLNAKTCQRARLSRDPRFDGKFFTAVKTTGIYCRTVCPVFPPKEENVQYFESAIECAEAGFRPCLRCRPDSAPNSPAWKGVNTTLDRAISLIEAGALQDSTLTLLAERLGITDRYLRKLFEENLGVSPKRYALYQQCLFAKQLLHQTQLPITQVALASGFKSIRRFNDCVKSQLQLTPSDIRKSGKKADSTLSIKMYYRPPFDWAYMHKLLTSRAVNKLEWIVDNGYGRTFTWGESQGRFTAYHNDVQHCFDVDIELDDVTHLKPIIKNIRRIFDLDVDMQVVEQGVQQCFTQDFTINSGIRLPGIWNVFEAGVRAILGQQISVTAARNLVEKLVDELGEKLGEYVLFPTPATIANNELNFFKMPGARKQTLRNFAQFFVDNHDTELLNNPESWLEIKGIGPWTIEYVQLRGMSHPDIFLSGDLGVKNALTQLDNLLVSDFSADKASPWRSYLTFQLWSQL